MTTVVKIPKTFVFIAKFANQKKGYVRFKSYLTDSFDIKYQLTIVNRITDASRYVTFDNAKSKAKALKKQLNIDELQMMDELTKKIYNIH